MSAKVIECAKAARPCPNQELMGIKLMGIKLMGIKWMGIAR